MGKETNVQLNPDANAKLTELYNSIIGKIDKLINLNITTVVVINNEEKKIASTFNLLDGDIKTTIDAVFINGDYKEIRDFHTEREKLATEIFKNNVQTVQNTAKWVAELIQGKST
jgi:alkyl hydroperoxide reductase subunit AhpC